MKPKNVSVVIITWNSKPHLGACLDKLVVQTYQDFEVIIIDNDSSDGCLNGIQEEWSLLHIQITKLEKNTGFTVANNIGAKLAQGKWLVLLNADAFPEPNWLENLVKAAEKYPNASLASRQIQALEPYLLDGEGDNYHISGLAWRSGYGSPVQATSEAVRPVFSPCAAAALYPRQAFLDVGGFDENYFSYHEDVDLGFRLRLAGLQSYLVPSAVVHHVGSASTGKKSDFSVYYGHRNLVWTYYKNMPGIFLWIFLPLFLFYNLVLLVYFSLRGQGPTIFRAKWDALKGLVAMFEKRQEIQEMRAVASFAVIQAMDKNLFSPIMAFMRRSR